MKNLFLAVASGLVTLAFPVVASAHEISMGQQQQQQQSVSTSVSAINSVGVSNGFDFGDCNFCAGGDFDDFAGGVTQVVDVDTNVNQQQQQQQQIGDGNQSQEQNQNGQQQHQQQQQKQVAQVVPTQVVTTKSGTLPNTGADVAVPGALASLGTSIVAYLKHKKQLISLAFMQK